MIPVASRTSENGAAAVGVRRRKAARGRRCVPSENGAAAVGVRVGKRSVAVGVRRRKAERGRRCPASEGGALPMRFGVGMRAPPVRSGLKFGGSGRAESG